MAVNMAQKIIDHLHTHAGSKFTARELAEWFAETYPDERDRKIRESKNVWFRQSKDEAQKLQRIINIFIAEIGSQLPGMQRKQPRVRVTEERPRRYHYAQDETADAVANSTADAPGAARLLHKQDGGKLSEKDLYPLLKTYLASRNIYSLRIDEKRASNVFGKGGNKWLYPDLAGYKDLSENWLAEARDAARLSGNRVSEFWSFEVKLALTRGDVRHHFFQAVSNSRWANYAYLVTVDISDESVTEELRILSALHGVGVIKLNVENPPESSILIPAADHDSVDWDTANRIAEANDDFKAYLELVKSSAGLTADRRERLWVE